jgi:hypothetical protein
MGCAENRLSPHSNLSPSLELIPFPVDFINEVTRKYAPNRFISEHQFQAILKQLKLTPLSEPRREFYNCVRRGQAYDRLEMLVAHMMFGESESRGRRFRLLFETVDEEYAQVVSAEKAQLLIRTMLRVAISYYLRSYSLDPQMRQRLLATEVQLEAISSHLLSNVTDSERVTVQNWLQFAEKPDFRDIGTPEGLRKVALSLGTELAGNTATENRSTETLIGLQTRRRRHRGTVGERGQAVSASIRAKEMQQGHRSMPI